MSCLKFHDARHPTPLVAALALLGAAQTVSAATPSAGPLPAGPIERVTTSASGSLANASTSTCGLSADGRWVLVASDASNLVPGDTNRTSDLFLKNLDTGAVLRVTTQSNGAEIAAGGNCIGTTMTPDARRVAFNSAGAVHVKDTLTGQLTQVSPPPGTVPQVTGFSGGVLSDDGRKVVFSTVPELRYTGGYNFVNVVPKRLMVRDIETGGLEVLATDNGIVEQGEVIGSRFAISPDGTRVAFVSSSASLVPGDVNGRPDVFVRNLTDSTTTLVSRSSEGAPSNAVQYWNPSFASDTRVAFATGGVSSLGPHGLYLKDLTSGELSFVLDAVDGGGDAKLSADARQVVFGRLYNSGWNRRIWVRDLATGEEALVSAGATGTASNGNATGAVISRDGSTVIFGSDARNLIAPRPPAGVFHVYAKTIGAAGPR